MALKKTQYYREVPIIDAYIKVDDLSSYKNKLEAPQLNDEEGNPVAPVITYEHRINFVAAVRQNANAPEHHRTGQDCLYDLASGKNIFIQAYDYLKTLPEFDGAIDV